MDYFGKVRPGGILVWGANPAVSGADGELQWLIKDAAREGIPMVVVDPKPNELTRQAKYWLRIRPGTDGALALGILNLLIQEDLYDHDFVEHYTYGFDALKERCKEYDLERVAKITDIPAADILAAARWIGTTKPLGLEQGCAFEQSVNAMDTCRAIFMIPAITGNYDVPGGFVESMEIAPARTAALQRNSPGGGGKGSHRRLSISKGRWDGPSLSGAGGHQNRKALQNPRDVHSGQ